METLPPVMLVDDCSNDRLILTRLLRQAGVKNELLTFEGPEPACRFIEEALRAPTKGGFPVLIFTDLHMPGMDGCGFTRWLRERIPDHVPIIMATGSANEEDPRRAIAAGANRVYPKFPSASVLAELARQSGCAIA